MQNLVLISLFGILGVLSRFGIDRYFSNWNLQFPASTLLINILGSFAAGAVYALGENRFLSENFQLGLLVGFCGGFTTFSAYTIQTVVMLERGKIVPALSYILLSPILGSLAAFSAILIIRKLFQ